MCRWDQWAPPCNLCSLVRGSTLGHSSWHRLSGSCEGNSTAQLFYFILHLSLGVQHHQPDSCSGFFPLHWRNIHILSKVCLLQQVHKSAKKRASFYSLWEKVIKTKCCQSSFVIIIIIIIRILCKTWLGLQIQSTERLGNGRRIVSWAA